MSKQSRFPKEWGFRKEGSLQMVDLTGFSTTGIHQCLTQPKENKKIKKDALTKSLEDNLDFKNL